MKLKTLILLVFLSYTVRVGMVITSTEDYEIDTYESPTVSCVEEEYTQFGRDHSRLICLRKNGTFLRSSTSLTRSKLFGKEFEQKKASFTTLARQ